MRFRKIKSLIQGSPFYIGLQNKQAYGISSTIHLELSDFVS
jgi:hypothetical protein